MENLKNVQKRKVNFSKNILVRFINTKHLRMCVAYISSSLLSKKKFYQIECYVGDFHSFIYTKYNRVGISSKNIFERNFDVTVIIANLCKHLIIWIKNKRDCYNVYS